MIKIFSQKINQDTFDIVYDCLINPDSNNVGFTHTYEYTNGTQVNSFFVMDFLSLREFINNGKVNYENVKFKFTVMDNHYEISTKAENLKILLPKSFLLDSYDVLEKQWEDDD